MNLFEIAVARRARAAQRLADLRSHEPATQVPVATSTTRTETDDTCAICMGPFIDGDRLSIMVCTHRLHVECLDAWCATRTSEIKQQADCPICRTVVSVMHTIDYEEEGR